MRGSCRGPLGRSSSSSSSATNRPLAGRKAAICVGQEGGSAARQTHAEVARSPWLAARHGALPAHFEY